MKPSNFFIKLFLEDNFYKKKKNKQSYKILKTNLISKIV